MDTQPDQGDSVKPTGAPADPPSRPLVLSYATPGPANSNPAAVGAMGCALAFFAVLWLCPEGILPDALLFPALSAMAGAAIVLGYLGMKRTEPRRRGRGLARAAFVLGWVLLLLFVVGVILPRLYSVGPRAPGARCASNLRQIGQGLALYANDNNNLLPPDLGVLIATTDLQARCFVCPGSSDTPATGPTTQAIARNAVTQKGHCSYVYLGAGLNQKSISPDRVLAYEITLKHHENEGMNVLYGDGYVDWLSKQAALALIAELQAGHNPPRPPGATTRP